MNKSSKLPAIQFYPGDWKKDAGVQSLSFHDRGVWMEILFLMHESSDRGKLTLNGNPVTNDALARMLGIDLKTLNKTLSNIISAGVADIEESTGIILNRRMVRDEAVRRVRIESGKLGGNPNLVNQNPTKRPSKIQPNDQAKYNQKPKQNPTPSISFSTSSSELIKTSKDYLKDEIENTGYWMSTRNILSGYFQGDEHLKQLLDSFCELNKDEPFNDTKHRVNSFRAWVKRQNDSVKESKTITATPIKPIFKPFSE